ncbi:DUF3086 domain-containing protein [Geminocystis sp. NIES-3709]|uniref:DUF3086 domain-containing protein n=1 Tax=Geminocystis sp. NIES-3709 TaxID=1617448 RepID=UPI0005FC3943|nr:DUF3086 domain-containing protein [Geminocystis sp. NIES-3709]BAQ63996.1 hypothetical protein GM3709_761 [Geminocystis sp. NIES-3709]
MSDIKKELQEKNIDLDYSNDDDLWEAQSEKTSTINLETESIEFEESTVNSSANIEELTINPSSDFQEKENHSYDAHEVNNTELENLSIEEMEIDLEQKNETNSVLEHDKIEVKWEETEREIIDDISIENQDLITEIKTLEIQKQNLIKDQEKIRENINLLLQEGLKELEQKKQDLELQIQKLERRKEKIDREMKTTFSGVSQDLAIRVQGFKDYLVGSLQDLAAAAEQLELPSNNSQSWEKTPNPIPIPQNNNPNPQFVEKNFKEETRQIRSLLDQYRTRPDYYGPPWQLRRTFEPIHAERVKEWFFTQGGRGTLRSMGSRLQNILIASAIMSILSQLYGDRARTLILADTPERLGEWRRGLQDCLGISRSDFGPNRGVVLFETSEALIQKGDRIVEEKDLPLIIMDQTDDKVSLSLLKFPLWLAFAPEQTTQSSNYYY